jgi:hypothetical protein
MNPRGTFAVVFGLAVTASVTHAQGVYTPAGFAPGDDQRVVIRFAEPDEPAPRATVVPMSPAFQEKHGKNGDANGKNGNGNEEREPIKDNAFLIEEAYNQEDGVVQHILLWSWAWGRQRGLRTRFSEFQYNMELPICGQDHQLSFAIPYQDLYERDTVTGDVFENGGLADIPINYRYQLTREEEWYVSTAPRFTVILPTGDEGRGLGLGEVGYEFDLPISKQCGDFGLHLNIGFGHTPGVSLPLGPGIDSPRHDLWSYNLGAAIQWHVNLDFNLFVEAVAVWEDGINEFGEKARDTLAFVNPGFVWAPYTSDEVQWVVGASVPIGLTRESEDIGLIFYMSIEHAFKRDRE